MTKYDKQKLKEYGKNYCKLKKWYYKKIFLLLSLV